MFCISDHHKPTMGHWVRQGPSSLREVDSLYIWNHHGRRQHREWRGKKWRGPHGDRPQRKVVEMECWFSE